MKIGFIYYSFYPVTGGASVHGYNLAKELVQKGHELYKINGDPDPFTHRMKYPLPGLFWILANCDLIYLRMDYFLNFRNLVSFLPILMKKPWVAELNSPSDELHLFGRSESYIRRADKIISKILSRADAVITVSDSLKQYCEEALDLSDLHVIENGGEIIEEDQLKNVGAEVKQEIARIKKKYSTLIVWSGSVNQMQDIKRLKEIAEALVDDAALVLIVKEDQQEDKLPSQEENLFVFRDLTRDEVKFILCGSDIGLALYREYPWSRWGFYNSSLKIFEYLNNGLLTITNTEGTRIQKRYPNFRTASSVDEIVSMIEEYNGELYKIENARTWLTVAEETDRILTNIVNRC